MRINELFIFVNGEERQKSRFSRTRLSAEKKRVIKDARVGKMAGPVHKAMYSGDWKTFLARQTGRYKKDDPRNLGEGIYRKTS